MAVDRAAYLTEPREEHRLFFLYFAEIAHFCIQSETGVHTIKLSQGGMERQILKRLLSATRKPVDLLKIARRLYRVYVITVEKLFPNLRTSIRWRDKYHFFFHVYHYRKKKRKGLCFLHCPSFHRELASFRATSSTTAAGWFTDTGVDAATTTTTTTRSGDGAEVARPIATHSTSGRHRRRTHEYVYCRGNHWQSV
ncbi:PREDICTED: uncharacterized protein LOC106744312 [Dinoponera quadriceps]|uniref:Uncharacterized protein LOC106744312 n=1 Tax=Dinoponera quadriceps TaxID=609295 RepID=A0A6P3X850_DINQU|nr:PREDICTED: uncharacterized protein LOC106744312 [Dinoponera quadriceps]